MPKAVFRASTLPFQYRMLHTKITSFQYNASVNDSVSVSFRIACRFDAARHSQTLAGTAAASRTQLLILDSLAGRHKTATLHRDSMRLNREKRKKR